MHRDGDRLWIPLRNAWRDVTNKPEEVVRQRFIRILVEEYGYSLEQMDQERRTLHGHRSPRADIAVWESVDDKAGNRTPVLVIECKADGIEIQVGDYYQGESYTRAVGCEFFIATNSRHTATFRLVPGLPGEFVAINEIPKAADWGNAKRLQEIRDSLRAFNRKEFQDLLFKCHSILRDVHKMDPRRAFDTISKVLFIKMYVERTGLHGTFTTDYLDQRDASRMPNDALVHDGLFELTKQHYRADDLFSETDLLDISKETFRRIVKELERFDLSKTGDDIKGLAFERFLGTTFRGELGQFFTPRPIVDFMVQLIDPRERELICDPAAGSGGFLIRAFEYVRDCIVADIQAQKDEARALIEAEALPEEEEERQIEAAFAHLNEQLLPSGDKNQPIDSRVGRLAWQCIYGTDAEPRAARTAKMNMIMHGDGHGGIHHHDGLLDINGIFGGRCLNLLKPGGRMGIVLPDGNLNNPSLAWLRRWAEGHARLMAVVSLPPETFRSSDATVKASLVFLRRFTEADSAAWEAAWAQAQAELDNGFDAQRNALHAASAPAILTGGDTVATRLLSELATLRVRRELPPWQLGEPPPYPRGIGRTAQAAPYWTAKPQHGESKKAAELKRQAQAALTQAQGATAAALAALKAAYRPIDDAHNTALWARVRELFDYPVFVAAPKAVGITSTGETGEGVTNDFATTLTAWRDFVSWMEKGAEPEDMPNFRLPSTA
ncbi:type I restriction enzyme HsdR N-terminal domain-containing protein [uncultured Thiodictyon sp.]|uniref:type I restriction enzyme HsdR N-terminal domain-containing protein n=1 Tax=uncultured Thiodictyon sp. TaxID=1846217 RepID=UPI0025DFBE0B|nr:type I restriction enzyme HsdR N-terminal domain-containing protein [uncultured Thiodictyon sp.]